MGASKTPKSTERRLAVAFSGGRDSTALLHATAVAAWADQTAPTQVLALHVHHGLSPNADAWAAQAQAFCQQLHTAGYPVEFHVTRLQLSPVKGESIEALARTRRYAALTAMALSQGVELVLLAHHQDDQAETFLLQALRGAGVAGLSAMPACIERWGVVWARPWLQKSRADVDAYVLAHDLHFVEDESNAQVRFARNRLRHEVMPVLARAFPDFAQSLGQSAQWAQDAAEAVSVLAAMDVQTCVSGKALQLSAWQALSPARQRHVLQHWLRQLSTDAPPSQSMVLRLQQEWPKARSGARWPWAGGELRLFRGRVSWWESANEGPAPQSVPGDLRLFIDGPGVYPVAAWGGVLVVSETTDPGLPGQDCVLVLRARSGGEQFAAGPGRPSRELKKQYQEAQVPVWQRQGPLVWRLPDDAQGAMALVYVPHLGLNAQAVHAPVAGAKRWLLHWESDLRPI